MYPWLHGLLSDKKDGILFSCFGIWHLLYLFVILGGIFLIYRFARNKSSQTRQRIVDATIGIAFLLYILDFFLMPFAYGAIDLEKLPFHACTAMCVMSFISSRSGHLRRFKNHFALLGLVSNFVYLIYPAGVMWHQVHPFCYRTVQTLLFHGVMSAYGIFVLALEDNPLTWKNWYRELFTIAGMTIWALVGNALYTGVPGSPKQGFNWFFVTQDPFYIFPKNIAPYIMPPLVILVFFAVEMGIYWLYFALKRRQIRR